MSSKQVIAVDLGAESGRVMQIGFDGKQFHQHEAHRFPNTPVWAGGGFYWDALRLWHDITTGISAVPDAASIGVDTWGVDVTLLDRDGQLVGNPQHYRQPRSETIMDWVFERVPRRTLFERTGIQFMLINGLYYLAELARSDSPMLKSAATCVTIADLFNYWLSGSRTCEFSHATTTQCFNAHTGDWDYETLSALGLSRDLFPPIVQPGTRIGTFNGIPVIAPACHDTGSAVISVPTTTENFAYLSSGTWSLIGLELDQAIINDAAYEANLTNEGGAYGTFRMLKNVMGLWLVQQCRATWRDQGTDYSYDDLVQQAVAAAPFRSLIEPDNETFLPAGDMPARIREFCQRTGQPVPETPGQIIRTIYESLALKYRYVLEKLTAVSGRTVDRLHIIGGGARNALLSQMTADAIGRVVITGPYEATALGNGIVQLITLGELGSMAEAREILSRTTETVTYEPKNIASWDEAYERFLPLMGSSLTF